jgi:hypothetical protein
MATTPTLFNQNTAAPPVPGSTMNRYKTQQVSRNYQVRLEVRGDQQLLKTGGKIFPIIANLPERYNMDFSSSWSSPFARSDISSVAGSLAGQKYGAAAQAITGGALNVLGISSRLKSQSIQVWDSTSPMTFSTQMIFNAQTDSMSEVKERHRALLKLCAPSEGPGGVLFQPGPTVAGAVRDAISFSENSRQIDMYIGNYLKLENVVINSVSSDVSTLCTADGIPLNMTINISVSSFFSSFTSEDIDKMFLP